MTKLYKTVIVVWSEDDTSDLNLARIGKDVEIGDSHCSSRDCNLIEDPESDDDWDDTSFFEDDDDCDDDDDDDDDDDEDEDDEDEDDDEEEVDDDNPK
jgi:hypothetical protein